MSERPLGGRVAPRGVRFRRGRWRWTGRPTWSHRLLTLPFRRAAQKTKLGGLTLHWLERREVERLTDALELIGDVDPVRQRRLARYMPMLFVHIGPTSGFSPHLGAGFIALGRRSRDQLASSIVHELTHAYLYARFAMPYSHDLKREHERLCLEEQLRFHRRLSGHLDCSEEEAERYVQRVHRFLEATLARRWWDRSGLDELLRFIRHRRAERRTGASPATGSEVGDRER